jgi:hypothetical protein
MTQETTKQEAAKDATSDVAAQPAKELDTQQAESVGGGTDICNPVEFTDGLTQAYDNLVDTTSHIIETVAKAL